MGRPYAAEVGEFAGTYSRALETPLDGLVDFVESASDAPLCAVGSGGSLTACVLASVLHGNAGHVAKPVTPMEFLDSPVPRDASVLVVSAGGNNGDVLAAFDGAAAAGPANLGVLCARPESRLAGMAERVPGAFLFRGDMPKKDGFLATNSLLATAVWLARAYNSDKTDLPGSLEELSSQARESRPLPEKMKVLAGRRTIIILHDLTGKPAAADLESKLVEAGLCNAQVSDYRNFAHGRHNWIDKNPGETGIMYLVTPACRSLAASTMRLIPDRVPAAEIGTERTGPAGMLSLLVQAMRAVKTFGEFRGIDPGRPGVAEFGRRLYGMGMAAAKTGQGPRIGAGSTGAVDSAFHAHSPAA